MKVKRTCGEGCSSPNVRCSHCGYNQTRHSPVPWQGCCWGGEAGLRGSSRSYWSPGVGHRGLHGEGLAHSHREGRSGGSFSTPGRGPPLASHISPSPLSQRTHSAPCVLGPGKPVSFFSLKCLLHTSGSLTHWETVWASRVGQLSVYHSSPCFPHCWHLQQ